MLPAAPLVSFTFQCMNLIEVKGNSYGELSKTSVTLHVSHIPNFSASSGQFPYTAARLVTSLCVSSVTWHYIDIYLSCCFDKV